MGGGRNVATDSTRTADARLALTFSNFSLIVTSQCRKGVSPVRS